LKILLDHNIPAQLKPVLIGHQVFTARDLRWDDLENGDLISASQKDGFQVMVTGDQSIFYQQNNRERIISLIVLSRTKRHLLIGQQHLILEAIGRSTPGSFELVHIQNRHAETPAVK
jgi:hypothetical protein